MCIANQHLPLILRQAFVALPSIGLLAPAATSVGVGAGVPRVVHGAAGAPQGQGHPSQLALLRSGNDLGREEQAMLPEVLDRGAQRAGAIERLKEQPYCLLHLLVGVEDDAPAGVVDEPHRQAAAQIASASLVEDPPAQARPQHVKLRFAHGPFEPKQQSVVEVCGIVDAVLVENQRVGQRADFQKPVPVGRDSATTARRANEAVGLADRTREIVGIVGNTKEFGLVRPAPATMFVPAAQVQDGLTAIVNRMIPVIWVVRTTGDARSLARAVQRDLLAVATQEAPDNFRTMRDVLSASIAQQRFNMLLLSLFAGLAVALGAVGLYGVLSYLVAQRTHEIAIRMALGASRREVLHLVVRHGLGMTFTGLGLGIVTAGGLTRLLAGLLYGVKPTDPSTFGTVAFLLCGVAFLACYIPAHRATRVDPIVALRYE